MDRIAAAIKPRDDHFARTKLLALENTINGKVLPRNYVHEATGFAHGKGLATHLDGARVFNAVVADNGSLADACAGFDSVSICFSKGLGAPVGSVLVGRRDFIERAHRWRKVLGGGMRQAGILAAACLYALDHNVARLADDHKNAARLALGLGQMEEVQVTAQATNMVFLRLAPEHCAPLAAYLKERGILVRTAPSCRLVTHLDVNAKGIDAAVAAIKDYFFKR